MSGKLTARKVETAKPGKYADGGNLYLVVSKSRSKKQEGQPDENTRQSRYARNGHTNGL